MKIDSIKICATYLDMNRVPKIGQQTSFGYEAVNQGEFELISIEIQRFKRKNNRETKDTFEYFTTELWEPVPEEKKRRK